MHFHTFQASFSVFSKVHNWIFHTERDWKIKVGKEKEEVKNHQWEAPHQRITPVVCPVIKIHLQMCGVKQQRLCEASKKNICYQALERRPVSRREQRKAPAVRSQWAHPSSINWLSLDDRMAQKCFLFVFRSIYWIIQQSCRFQWHNDMNSFL